jgi:RHS repeat-associated protein
MAFNKEGSSDNKYLYNGKELQEDAIGNGMLDWLDYGARMYDAELGRWFVVDPLAEKYYTYSLYAFTSNNPIINLEIDGQWYVKVHAYNDRAKYGYAVMRVYDKHSSLLREYTVRVQGMKHVKNNNNPRNRTLTYGDTPTGKYRIIGFSDRLPKTDEDVYGPNPVLELDYIEGEAAGQRNGMHAHGGRQKNNPKNPKGTLWNTGGCMRMKDDDILDFYNTISNLETDDIEEEGTFLTVENDLKSEDGEYNPPERDSNYKQDDDNQSSINYWSMFIRNLLLYNSNSK